MRQLIIATAVSVMFSVPALAHDTLLNHSHSNDVQLAHSDHKSHSHAKKLKKIKDNADKQMS